MSEEQKYQMVSIYGGPTITFHVKGDTMRAELGGASLYAEARAPGGGAEMRITDSAGEILADLMVNPRRHRNITENVMDVGSALLWSHWRYVEASINARALEPVP